MKHIKRLLIFYILVFPLFAEASHMMGAEITYKWLGNLKYEVTAKIYRDCRGIPLNSPLMSISDYNGTTITLSYTRTSIEDISLTCSDTISKPCYPSNTTVGKEGVELHTFVAIVDFSASPYSGFVKSSCKVYFSVEQCCRNGAITTLNQGNLYVDAMLDLCKAGFRNTSPQFKSRSVLTAFCNQPFTQNFGSKDFVDYDSLAYELVTPLNGAKSNESYLGSFSSSIPMTPYCVTSGVINCSPSPSSKPPRGFYFNKLTGDVVFTPSSCSEVGVIALKVSEYRRDSTNSKWVLIGYVVRDIQIAVAVSSGNNYQPVATLSSTYNFRTRQNQCIDIKTFDTMAPGASSANKGDKTFMTIKELPSGATFRYVDSAARNKTGRLCWNIHDSVYIKFKNKNKLLPLTLELRDNFCSFPSVVQQSFSIKILPPDSSGFLSIKTFIDPNKNNIKDTAESPVPVLVKFKDKSAAYYVATDEKGEIKDSFGVGKINIGVALHPYFTSTAKDTSLMVKFDSAHHLNFGIHQSNGIFGRLYNDINSNCKFDKGEMPYSGYKVFTDSNKYMGISDNNGIYYINAPKGSYNLKCEFKPGKYTVNCPASKTISLTINGDSAYMNNDFGISRNMKYTDVGTGINISRLRRGNVSSVTLYCVNNGPLTRKNIILYSPVSSKFDLTYNSSLFASAGSTAQIKIDSIQPFQTFFIKLDFYVSPTNFKSGDKICFSLKTDSTTTAIDSLTDNNTSQECGWVEAPYDPNEKLVALDSAKTTNDQTISYTIHFQNNGTDTATRVVVSDTIDTHYLRLSDFRMNWSDYPCQTIISGNIIHFIFDNINLPYFSKSGNQSMAGFNFSLGLKSSVQNESIFSNRAAIYFDFEDPVFTRKAIATINSPIVLSTIKQSSVCKNESNRLYYRNNITFNPGNQMILEISDGNGSFSAPVVLKTINSESETDSIDFSVPLSFNAAKYTLRIRSTNPPLVSIPGSGTINFNALTTPTFLVNSNLNNNKACENDTLKISMTNKSYSYKILKNNMLLYNFDTASAFRFKLKINDSFKIIALNNSTKCKDTSSIFPYIFKQPIINAGILNRRKEYCSGEQIDIKASGGLFYVYSDAAGILSNKSADSVFKTTLNVSTKFRVSGEDLNGCSHQSDTMSVTVNPLPVANISCNPDPICFGDSNVTLQFGQASHYDLFKNNSLILYRTTASTYKITSLAEGDIYKITAYSDKGCFNNSKELPIVIHPLPLKPVISKNNNNLSVNFTGNIKWYKNGLLLTNSTNTIADAPGGIYRVVVTNPEGCTAISDAMVHKNTGLQATFRNAFNIYPNPASRQITIDYLSSEEAFNVVLYDMNGRIIYQSSEVTGSINIDVSEFRVGLYNLRIESGNGQFLSQTISIIR